MKRLFDNKVRLIVIAGSLAAFIILLFAFFFPRGSKSSLTVTALDVGKGDALVILSETHAGMIDTGYQDSYEKIDAFLKEHSVSSLDFLILTHYDKDHIGSAPAILENYNVKTLYLPAYESEKALYPDVMADARLAGETVYVDQITGFSFDGVKSDIIPASDPAPLLEDEKNRDNDMSLVCMMTYNGTKLLFAGDVENSRMEQMLEDPYDYSCDWIKIPHHGNYDKKLKKLLKAAGAGYAVVSTSSDVLDDSLEEVLEDRDIETFYTFNGDVTTRLSGRDINVSYGSPAP